MKNMYFYPIKGVRTSFGARFSPGELPILNAMFPSAFYAVLQHKKVEADIIRREIFQIWNIVLHKGKEILPHFRIEVFGPGYALNRASGVRHLYTKLPGDYLTSIF